MIDVSVYEWSSRSFSFLIAQHRSPISTALPLSPSLSYYNVGLPINIRTCKPDAIPECTTTADKVS
jgi:hypothetical protein